MPEILVAVRPSPHTVRDLASGIPAERLAERMDEIAATLETVIVGLRQRLNAVVTSPTPDGMTVAEVQLAFSIELQAEAGIVLARASTSTGLEATVTWRRQ
jgi:hypothetical protein